MFVTDGKEVLCVKGKFYQIFNPTDFEDQSGICFWVESELDEKIPLTMKLYNKYFSSISEMRDNKISQILK